MKDKSMNWSTITDMTSSELIDLDENIDEGTYNTVHSSICSKTIRPWLLVKGYSSFDNCEYVYRLVNGSLMGMDKNTKVLYELLDLQLQDVVTVGGLIILEPLRSVNNLAIDEYGRYILNAVKITTKLSRQYTKSPKTRNGKGIDYITRGSMVLSSWNKLCDFYNRLHDSVDIEERFCSFITATNLSLGQGDNDRVFKNARKIITTNNNPRKSIKQFAQIFDMKQIRVHINPSMDMRGLYTSEDLNGLGLAEQMVPGWFSDDVDFNKTLQYLGTFSVEQNTVNNISYDNIKALSFGN